MAGNGKIFLCYAPEDTILVSPLTAALDAWGKDYQTSAAGTVTGNQLNDQMQDLIASRDVLIRICTAAAQRSIPVSLQLNAFRGLQAADRQRGREHRTLVNLVLDAGYVAEPFDKATIFIDGVSRPRRDWLADVGRALGLSQTGRLSRRAVLGLGAATVATLAAAGAGVTFAADLQTRKEVGRLPGALLWKKVMGVKSPPLPAIVDENLYVVYEKGIARLDLATGAEHWLYEKVFKRGYSGACVHGGTAYVAFDYDLLALDAGSGKLKWTASSAFSIFGGFSTVVNGLIHAVTNDGHLIALSANDGKQVWTSATTDIVNNVGLLSLVSVPASDGHTIYFGTSDHYVYALGASDGAARWKTLVRGGVSSSPVLVGSTMVVGCADGMIYGLATADGKILWRVRTGKAVHGSPVVAGNVVYIGSDDEYLYALDGATGAIYWVSPSGTVQDGFMTDGWAIDGPPSVEAGVVAVSANKTVIAFSLRDGSKRWTIKPGGDYLSDPSVGSGVVCFGELNQPLTGNTPGVATLYAYGA